MIKKIILSSILIIGLYSCAAISDKVEKKADKENAYLATFLKKPSTHLTNAFGKPTKAYEENNQTVYEYDIKGRVFDCHRKFTIDKRNIITGFVSTCWD
jgi:hypothetical protein